MLDALGFGRRDTAKNVQSLKRRVLHFEPLEERQLLAVLLWDPQQSGGANLGGSGTWTNGGNALWYNPATQTDVAWNNANGDRAVFGGTAGTVTVTSGVSAGGIGFETSNYTITSSTITLTQSNTPGQIDVGSGITDTIASVLAGSVGLAKTGYGTLALAGSDTYTGGTTIALGGTLHVTNLSGIGSGAIADNGTLAFNVNGTESIFNAISGTGSLVQQGPGNLLLCSNNNYTGGTTISGGSLWLYHAGAIGPSGTIDFEGGMLQYETVDHTDYSSRFSTDPGQAYRIGLSGTVTFASPLTSSDGSLTTTGHGTLILAANANNTYSGGTTIGGSGTLQVGNGGTAGSVGPGNIVDNGTLTFDRSDDVPVSNTISGTGRLTQQGTGTLTLTGANTYGGWTTINAGTLQVGDFYTSTATLGTGAVVVNSNGTLDFCLNGTHTIANSISGSGTVIQEGDPEGDPLILTGDGSNFSGTTQLYGTLQVGNGETTGGLGHGRGQRRRDARVLPQ